MAFKSRSLASFFSVPTGTANKSVNFYLYATEDANATVLTASYFADARLNVNDVIICVSVAAGTGVVNVLKVLTDLASGSVTVDDSFAAPT